MALSDVKRGEILGMSKAGVKSPKIAVTLDVSERTVRRILAQYKERGTILTKKSPGRPCKFTERDTRTLVAVIRKNWRATLSDITKALPIKVSESTVRRKLHSLRKQ